jgi:hypothetical protein
MQDFVDTAEAAAVLDSSNCVYSERSDSYIHVSLSRIANVNLPPLRG